MNGAVIRIQAGGLLKKLHRFPLFLSSNQIPSVLIEYICIIREYPKHGLIRFGGILILHFENIRLQPVCLSGMIILRDGLLGKHHRQLKHIIFLIRILRILRYIE